MFEQIEVTRRGAVAVLTMVRPTAGNRFTEKMGVEIIAALDRIRRDDDVHGCVLTGHDDVFCLGGDYRGAGTGIQGRMDFARAHIDVFHAMSRLGKPLIGAVNGNAHAGGFALLLACDMAYIVPDATVGLPEVVHGLFPLLALALARDAMPKKRLFEIVYESKLLSADEAVLLGLANAIVSREDVVGRACATVERVTAGNRAVLMIGRDLYHGMRGATPEQALDQARFALGAALSATDQAAVNQQLKS
jgi:enoyl-CoA hydratase/carnithine racemase